MDFLLLKTREIFFLLQNRLEWWLSGKCEAFSYTGKIVPVYR